MKLPIVWWNEHLGRGSWGCVAMLNEMFDMHPCSHMSGRPGDLDGAVVVIHGGVASREGAGEKEALSINAYVKPMKWCLFIDVGNEEGDFPTHLLEHPNSRLWIQMPLPPQRADRYLVAGYPAATKKADVPRTRDWFFAGQVTHARRVACMEALRPLTNGLRIETPGFWQGIPREDYLVELSRSKIIPCPCGPNTPESFRIWEALECGAVPIVDGRSLKQATVRYWDIVLPHHPLPMIQDWSLLPERMDAILNDYDRIQRETQEWWAAYKGAFMQTLSKDLIWLGVI